MAIGKMAQSPTKEGGHCMKKDAVISDCGQYRYSLTRIWDESKPKVLFVMLNPSTADAYNDDPTIRRCIGFAKAWGFGGLYVGNLFAYRATNPEELLKSFDPVGFMNSNHLASMSNAAEATICAWGNSKIIKKLLGNPNKVVNKLFTDLHYLELSIDGTPKHPLYLKKNLKPIRFNSHTRPVL
jgi:hypothetical protein